MSISLRIHHMCRQALVLVMLLSFLGQAFASASDCMSPKDKGGSENTSASLERNSDAQSPCHQVMSEVKADIDMSMAMDCCDQETATLDHSCSCPDGGCTGSLSFLPHASSSTRFMSEAPAIFKPQRFSSQIDSALFRPPIV